MDLDKKLKIMENRNTLLEKENKKPCIVFWENVEGVLTDKTNAFGCLISSLAGLENVVEMKKMA